MRFALPILSAEERIALNLTTLRLSHKPPSRPAPEDEDRLLGWKPEALLRIELRLRMECYGLFREERRAEASARRFIIERWEGI